MIPKTPEEKAAIKAAKKSWKENRYDKHYHEQSAPAQQKQEPKRDYILTGLMEGENVLPDDYLVYWDFLYVADQADGTHAVIKSYIKGTVKELKNDIFNMTGFRPSNIYNCKQSARNIF